MVMNSRHVALLVLAAFVAGGAIVLAAVLFVSAQTNTIRLTAQRDTLVQQTDKLVDAVQNSAAEKGRATLVAQQGRDAEDELRATIADLRDRLDGSAQGQGNPAEQLEACRHALAEQMAAAQSYVNALNIANQRVSSLSNALENIGQSQAAQLIRLQTDQKYADALDDANAKIVSLTQALQYAGTPAATPVLAAIPSYLPPPSAPPPPAYLGAAYVGPLPYFISSPRRHDHGAFPSSHGLNPARPLSTSHSGF
jgi:hypothetical protein